MSISNSEQLKPILEKNAEIMLNIAKELKEYDSIGASIFTKLGLKDECKIKYDLNARVTAELVDNVVVIQPYYFLDKDKSELEFALSHEIGHYRYPIIKRLSMFIPVISLISYYSFDYKRINPFNLLFLGSCTLISTCLLKRQEETWCDNYAVANIGKEGGINFFTSLSALEEKEKKDYSLYKRLLSYDWTHPSFHARIKNINSL